MSESFDLANVESVTFNVKSQEGVIALKLGMTNASGWYDDVEACYGQNGQKQYTIVPEKTEGTFDKVVIMTTQNDASFCLTSVVVTLKEGSGSQITHGENIIDNGDFSNQDFSSWSASKGRKKILETIVSKSTLKQKVFDNTFATFNDLKETLSASPPSG